MEVEDNELKDSDGNLQESIGKAFLTKITGHSKWVRTFKDGSQRKRYAFIGGTYDSGRNVFLRPQEFSSWTLDESTYEWVPPVAYPDDDKFYKWNEGTKSWDETTPPPELSR